MLMTPSWRLSRTVRRGLSKASFASSGREEDVSIRYPRLSFQEILGDKGENEESSGHPPDSLRVALWKSMKRVYQFSSVLANAI